MTEVILNGNIVDFDQCVNLMDDEIRENLHMEYGWASEQEFLDMYCQDHMQKFGKEFAL